MKYLLVLLLGLSIFFSSCQEEACPEENIIELALEEFLRTNSLYFPIDNIPLLENIKKRTIEEKCNVHIDSVKAIYFHSKNNKLSEYKLKSIYLEILDTCYSEEELTKKTIKLDSLSDWSQYRMTYFYPCREGFVETYQTYPTHVAGLPYKLEYVGMSEVRSRETPARMECEEYIMISPVFKSCDYFFCELRYGCTGVYEQKILYVFKNYLNKFMIVNKLETDYVF